MSKVLNKYRDNIPEDAVYIGRGSRWGNPFKIGKDGTREEVVEKYRELINRPGFFLRVGIGRLVGKDLVCYCAPAACHGDILLEMAEKYDREHNLGTLEDYHAQDIQPAAE